MNKISDRVAGANEAPVGKGTGVGKGRFNDGGRFW